MKRYSYQIASVILAVAIFCLWYFKYPHILSVREQSSLFIWDWTYVEDRLSMPWGWANLLWSFIEQFFFNEALGAAIMATLSLLTLWLTWLLLNLSIHRLNSQWRIYSFFLALIPAIIVCYLPLHPLGGTEEEMQYDYLIRKGDWQNTTSRSPYPCRATVLLPWPSSRHIRLTSRHWLPTYPLQSRYLAGAVPPLS